MAETETSEARASFPIRYPRSIAAAAQLLELWVTRRAVLDPNVLDCCVHMVSDVYEAAVERLREEALNAGEE